MEYTPVRTPFGSVDQREAICTLQATCMSEIKYNITDDLPTKRHCLPTITHGLLVEVPESHIELEAGKELRLKNYFLQGLEVLVSSVEPHKTMFLLIQFIMTTFATHPLVIIANMVQYANPVVLWKDCGV